METVTQHLSAQQVFDACISREVPLISRSRAVSLMESYAEFSNRSIKEQLSSLQEENKELKSLVSEMCDLTKCGYAHNYGSPDDSKLEMLAKAISIRDNKTITAEQIKNWLH